jgi:hypothetical protein
MSIDSSESTPNPAIIHKTHTYEAGAGLLAITKGGTEKQWKSMERRKL